MRKKILIPLFGNEIAPRFDLAREVVIISLDLKNGEHEEKILLLPETSSEQLCQLVLTEGAQVVICGGIEEEYYRFLKWKRVNVFDSVMGPWKQAFEDYSRGTFPVE